MRVVSNDYGWLVIVKLSDGGQWSVINDVVVCSFVAETDQLKDQWVEAMRNSIAEALSNYEVAEKIWAEPSNQKCADCTDAKPEWAAINLGVVFCKRCAGKQNNVERKNNITNHKQL